MVNVFNVDNELGMEYVSFQFVFVDVYGVGLFIIKFFVLYGNFVIYYIIVVELNVLLVQCFILYCNIDFVNYG